MFVQSLLINNYPDLQKQLYMEDFQLPNLSTDVSETLGNDYLKVQEKYPVLFNLLHFISDELPDSVSNALGFMAFPASKMKPEDVDAIATYFVSLTIESLVRIHSPQ